VRPLEARDIPIVLPLSGMDNTEKLEIADRYSLLGQFGMCAHVAVDQRSDTPCYIQWLVGSARNDVIRRLGCFPALDADEALLEGAYTPPQHRGLGIMSAAMAIIAERADSLGARYVLTFVGDDNIPSLKGCRRAGFKPHMLHYRSQWGFGIRCRNTFGTFDADDTRRELTF
jgi:GNAT superfamily N-acetyltransferase